MVRLFLVILSFLVAGQLRAERYCPPAQCPKPAPVRPAAIEFQGKYLSVLDCRAGESQKPYWKGNYRAMDEACKKACYASFGKTQTIIYGGIPMTIAEINCSPLTLNFSKTPNEFITKRVPFDFFGNQSFYPQEWVKSDVAFLALDEKGTRKIESGRQLFGSATSLIETNTRAQDGFQALAQYDQNRDGLIDRYDPIFDKLVGWFDLNTDGVSETHEVFPLSTLRVTALDLEYTDVTPANPTGAYVGLRSRFQYEDRQGRLLEGWLDDVFLPLGR